MEEDKIKKIFEDFDPPLSSDFQFMSRLESGMRSVEIVKEHNTRLRRMNRKAVAIAVAVGFICGFLFSLALPYIGETMTNLRNTVLPGSFLAFVVRNYLPIIWTMIAGVSAFIAINTFELSVFLLERGRQTETLSKY
ncbi:MAG: hypothetical protein HDS95_06375 [Bacteroidales bacterium]|nr:hypothetical protein [Bacteroidales bacterium]MBD5387639.1 hypothetical protein [bacterium]